MTDYATPEAVTVAQAGFTLATPGSHGLQDGIDYTANPATTAVVGAVAEPRPQVGLAFPRRA